MARLNGSDILQNGAFSRKALPPLDLTGSPPQVAEHCRQWKRSYQYYIDGKGITNATCKKAQLFHLAGMEVQDIYEDLQDPGPFNAETDDVPYERHVFYQLA